MHMDEVKIIEDMLNKKLKDDRVYVMVEVSYDMYANELFLTAGNKKSLVAYVTNNHHMCNCVVESSRDASTATSENIEPVRMYNLHENILNVVHSVHEEEYNDGTHGSHHIAIVDTCLDYNGRYFK